MIKKFKIIINGVYIYIEGNTKIKYSENAFLNPRSRLTRDLGVAFINAAFTEKEKKKIKVLDPTAATGIRGIRYANEAGIKNLTFLEINKSAYKVLKKNLSSCSADTTALNTSIQEFANTSMEKYDIIDLDPFGSIVPNLYDILKLAKDKTYLFLTATDTAVLCGAHEKACYKLYDAKPMHNSIAHEVGLRILLGFVARTAAQFNFGVEVVFAFSHAHYFRALVKLNHSSDNALSTLKNLGYTYYCNSCGYRSVSASFFPNIDKCACGAKLQIAGKLWAGDLINNLIMSSIADEFKKIPDANKDERKLVEMLVNEKNIPLYYKISQITKMLKVSSVKLDNIILELKNRGFTVEKTHFDPDAIKTDAPIDQITKVILMLSHTSANPSK